MDFERKTHKKLTHIMKSKNLKYSSMMNKEEMKKLLEINEKNPEVTVLLKVKTRVENKIKKEKEKPKKEIDIELMKNSHQKCANIISTLFQEKQEKLLKKLTFSKIHQ